MISTLIRQRNVAWAKAKKTNDSLDWRCYRELRNKCTKIIRKSKREYYLSMLSENLNNPAKFWKLVKSTSTVSLPPKAPEHLMVNQIVVKGRDNIVDTFNNYFSAGLIAKNFNSSTHVSTNSVTPDEQKFSFSTITTQQVYKALLKLDTKKSAGVDKIEPYFFKTIGSHYGWADRFYF